MALQESKQLDEHHLLSDSDPMLLLAKLDNDTPRFHQAMNGPHSDQYFQAMELELETLYKMDAFDVVPCSEADGRTILDSTWAYKAKRYPDGRIRKYKARLCVRDDQQEHGIDYFDTYAPAVSWTTVRLLLILAATLSFKDKTGRLYIGFCAGKAQ